MFKHLIFKIKYFRTIKEICRICRSCGYHIDEGNRNNKRFQSFNWDGGNRFAKIFTDNLTLNVYENSLSISISTNAFSSTQLFWFVCSFESVPEIPHDKYVPVIESTLNQILSILKEFEKEILEKKAKEEVERLADIDKILLKR